MGSTTTAPLHVPLSGLREAGTANTNDATPDHPSAMVTASVVTATFVAFAVCLLHGGVHKKQKINPRAGNESITTVTAPQKSLVNNFMHDGGGTEQPHPSEEEASCLSLWCCFNNLHNDAISKLASIVSFGCLCSMGLDSILCKSPVVWEPLPGKGDVSRGKQGDGNNCCVPAMNAVPIRE